MTPLFADTGYWIALLDPTDDLNVAAISAAKSYADRSIVTTDLVLVEFLNDFAGRGPFQRAASVDTVNRILSDGKIEVVRLTPELFECAITLFSQRSDKEWSLTDCLSFAICEDRGITEALAHDHHFEQAGYQALLRE